MKETIGNGLDSIIAQAIEEMKAEQGASFHLEHLNLAELERRTGISRARQKRITSAQAGTVSGAPSIKKIESLFRYPFCMSMTSSAVSVVLPVIVQPPFHLLADVSIVTESPGAVNRWHPISYYGFLLYIPPIYAIL